MTSLRSTDLPTDAQIKEQLNFNQFIPGQKWFQFPIRGLGHICDKKQWNRYLQAQYGRCWKVHFAKKTRGAWRSVKYLGRYLKRPPCRPQNCVTTAVVHCYYDHRTQHYLQQTLTQEEMIGRYISKAF